MVIKLFLEIKKVNFWSESLIYAGDLGDKIIKETLFCVFCKICLLLSYFHLHPRLARPQTGGRMMWWVGLRLATCLYTLRLFAALCSQTLRCISLHLQR